MILDDPPFLDHRKLKLACRNMIVKKKFKKNNLLKFMAFFLFSFIGPSQYIAHPSQYFE